MTVENRINILDGFPRISNEGISGISLSKLMFYITFTFDDVDVTRIGTVWGCNEKDIYVIQTESD